MQPLEYESGTPSGAVICKTTDSGLHIKVVATTPDAAMIRRLSNKAALVAGCATGLMMLPLVCLMMAVLNSDPAHLFSSVLLDGVLLAFVGGIFCMIWQSTSKRRFLSLARSLRQRAELKVEGDMLSVESDGPYGAINRSVSRSMVIDVGVVRGLGGFSFVDGSVRWLVIHLSDRGYIQLLPERSEGEYRIVVSTLREALGLDPLT